MNILLSTDRKYIIQTKVMMTSVGMHNTGVKFHVLLAEKLSLTSIATLTKTAHDYGNSIRFYAVPKALLERIPDDTERMKKHPKSCYSRLFVTEILPQNIHNPQIRNLVA